MKDCPECGYGTKVNESRSMTTGETFRMRQCLRCGHRTRTVEAAVEWDAVGYDFRLGEAPVIEWKKGVRRWAKPL